MKYWCSANSNLAYFIELTTILERQKQLLMSSISNLGGRESREIAVMHPDSALRGVWVIVECRVSMLGGRGRGFEVEVEVKKSRSRLKSRGRG